MYPDLEGKTALITGSGKRSGIGYAIAEKLAGCGSNIIIADLGSNPKETPGVKPGTMDEMESIANSLKEAHGVETLAVELDVMSTDSINRMMETIKTRFTRVDLLFNNAGAVFGAPNQVHDYAEDAWLKTVDINLHGVFRVSKAVIPVMLGKPGAIVNVASKAGKSPPLWNPAYAVAKAGVVMLTKVMARELAGSGIRVNAVCPGVIATDFTKWRFELEAQILDSTPEDRQTEMVQTIPLGRLGTSEEVAKLVAFLACGESSYMTGQAINVTGGQLMEL